MGVFSRTEKMMGMLFKTGFRLPKMPYTASHLSHIFASHTYSLIVYIIFDIIRILYCISLYFNTCGYTT